VSKRVKFGSIFDISRRHALWFRNEATS